MCKFNLKVSSLRPPKLKIKSFRQASDFKKTNESNLRINIKYYKNISIESEKLMVQKHKNQSFAIKQISKLQYVHIYAYPFI